MKLDLQNTIEQFVDLLMPELTPHEASLYIFLLRNSYLKNGGKSVRIGQRTIAQKYGQGPKKAIPSRQHVLRQLKMLSQKGCLEIGDTNRDGTLYTIYLPKDISLVKEKLVSSSPHEEEDYFTDAQKREELFIRDNWTCFYCGEKLTTKNLTLDHLIPQHKGGKHNKENLKTSCLICNSIKSGKTYEEAAPYLLKSIQERRQKE